ncbi:long-chain fatty alcohol dehydrogenase [Xylariaceae sp. FL1019]|nr:long-chain fatty alcohol dehydrogenase [Xylariaceae sp. FL1019]
MSISYSTSLHPRVLDHNTWFSESRWQKLLALLDAVIPRIVVGALTDDHHDENTLFVSETDFLEAFADIRDTTTSPPTLEDFRNYLASRAVDNPEFIAAVKRTIHGLPPNAQRQLAQLSDLLGSRLGSFLSSWSWTTLYDQSLARREMVLRTWQKSWLPIWPMLAKSFTLMAKICWAQSEPLLAELSGYKNYNREQCQAAAAHDFKFIQFDEGHEMVFLDTDVVIVGSGCGGSVWAKVLAEAGHKVLVVDKGYYVPPGQLPVSVDCLDYLFQQGMQSSDGSLALLAGSCWGGGGTVNWAASLPPQQFVLKEWAEGGLSFFLEQGFQDSVDRVLKFMGVETERISHNHGNKVLLEGARSLGWKAEVCPQNAKGEDHPCGHCGMGCRSGLKQGPTISWLPAAQKAGAQFIEGLAVSEVVFDQDNAGNRRAIGILGTWTSRDSDGKLHTPLAQRVQRQMHISARKVIVAAGTLNTPLLLMQSGLKSPHIGKHLHAHPAGNLIATFEEEVKGWEGSILTSVVTEFENLDGNGHGVKIERSAMVPYMTAFSLAWQSALSWKTQMLKLQHMNQFVAIARDRDSGSVSANTITGAPVVAYTPSKFDRANILQGLIAIAKLCYIRGARELTPFLTNVPSFKSRKPTSSRKVTDSDFTVWLSSLKRHKLESSGTVFGCAHQMGTCRMSANPADGVVDHCGRVWETSNLFIADASVFPSASGVNPMITIMAIADRIARKIADLEA